jgi:hypothetical protein
VEADNHRLVEVVDSRPPVEEVDSRQLVEEVDSRQLVVEALAETPVAAIVEISLCHNSHKTSTLRH